MASDVPDDLRVLIDLARDYLRTREGARRGVAILGRALTALAEWSEPAVGREPAEPSAPEPVQPPVPDAVPDPGPPAAPAATPEPPIPIALLPPLTFAPPPPVVSYTPPETGAADLQPLAVIADRCRLKAEACRFMARRVSRSTPRADIDDHAALVEQARSLPDSYLWMLEESHLSEPAAVWNDLAGAFTAAADAAEALRIWWTLPEPARDRVATGLLHLAAEAQGVLFAAVAQVRRERPDPDQIQLFVTVREEAARLQVFVTKYLKREDRADPSTGPSVSRRVNELRAEFQRTADAGKNRQKAFGNLRHKAARLRADPVAHAGEWGRVVEILDELVTGGLPPSNPEIRELLLPVADLVPEDLVLPPGATWVFREIDRYLASRPEPDAPPTAESLSAEVAEVRRLLAGRRVVLIGGLVRPTQRDALIEAFELADLQWVGTVEHESVNAFEAPIARAEVAVVLLAIRWSSHSYGDVQAFCDRFGKLLVRLPGGYHPNQVAHQILKQVGHRLRTAG